MKKKFYTVTNLVLTSLITMLGFGSCKTAKPIEKEPVQSDSLSIDTIDAPIRNPHREIRVLYGPPPAKREVHIIKKEDI